jgi:excisionase family DNA binding protein
MNPYEKLEQEERVWSVAETAAFLGYSTKHVYRLIRQHKIEGWIKIEGGHYIFFPCKLKEWMEKRFNGRPLKPASNSAEELRKEGVEA